MIILPEPLLVACASNRPQHLEGTNLPDRRKKIERISQGCRKTSKPTSETGSAPSSTATSRIALPGTANHSRPRLGLRVQPSQLFLLLAALFMILRDEAASVVVYQVRFIGGTNGRTDYALSGESIELSCHYIMKDEAEDVKQLIWSKNGKNFLRWRKNRPGLEVLNYTYKGHLDPNSVQSHLIIHNVTIDMHGKYKCSVKTDLGTHELEQDLTIISQTQCRLGDWRVNSQAQQCSESFQLDCRNMFPKPVPSCGLWNDRSNKLIRSLVVDISEELNKKNSQYPMDNYHTDNYYDTLKSVGNTRNNNSVGLQPSETATNTALNGGRGGGTLSAQSTYRIRHFSKFQLDSNSELLQYAGHLVFKCDIIIPDTSWKLSLVHKMFHYEDACLKDPLDTIEKIRSNYSQYTSFNLMQKLSSPLRMLSSDLEYELLGPQLESNHSPKAPVYGRPLLNCWQKPKLGSIARLSCSKKGNQVKLIGANLLECQSSGWTPLSSSQVERSTTKSQRKGVRLRAANSESYANNRIQEFSGPSELVANSRRTEYNSNENNDRNRDDKDDDHDDDDDDDDSENDNSNQNFSVTSANSQTTEFEFIPSGNAPETTTVATDLYSQDLPGSSMLPTCVIIRPSTYKVTKETSNRLPLLVVEQARPSTALNGHRADSSADLNHLVPIKVFIMAFILIASSVTLMGNQLPGLLMTNVKELYNERNTSFRKCERKSPAHYLLFHTLTQSNQTSPTQNQETNKISL